MPAIIIYPNADAGSGELRKLLLKLKRNKMQLYRNLPREDYLGLMRRATAIVGNSSSGLLEAPTFGLPAVNVGRRQIGRLQGENVINVEKYDKQKILEAINFATSDDFQQLAQKSTNPYGDGNSSQRIVDILKIIEINDELLNKAMTY